MAIELPAPPRFRSVQFGLRPRTAVFASPTSGKIQSLELPGAYWSGVYEVGRLTLADFGEWRAFISGLMGAAGRFNAFDPSFTKPFGAFDSGLDTPLVKGAGQTGKSLITDGWRNSGVNLLKGGDYFELTLNSIKRLFLATADASSDGSGNMTISMVPPLQESPADNLALVLSTPKVEMMLAGDSEGLWNVPVNKLISGFTFAARETP